MVPSKNSIVEEEGRDGNGAVVSVVVITLKRKRKNVMGGVGSGQHRGRERTDERRGRRARQGMQQLAATNRLFSEKQKYSYQYILNEWRACLKSVNDEITRDVTSYIPTCNLTNVQTKIGNTRGNAIVFRRPLIESVTGSVALASLGINK
jgi:hypothetical protein